MLKHFLLPVLILCFALLCSLPASASASTTEQQILDVIAHHPEAIIDSLNAYQQQQEFQQQAAQKAAIDRVGQDLKRFVADSPIRGDESASTMLIEFADFQCPFCIQAHAPIQALLDRHPNVAFVFKHLPIVEIHDQALSAAMAAWAAGKQGQFWPFYDALFESGESLTDDRYGQVAQSIGLNMNQWERDRHSPQASEAIAADVAQASELGIDGTPYFLVVNASGVVPIVGANVEVIEAQLNYFAQTFQKAS